MQWKCLRPRELRSSGWDTCVWYINKYCLHAPWNSNIFIISNDAGHHWGILVHGFSPKANINNFYFFNVWLLQKPKGNTPSYTRVREKYIWRKNTHFWKNNINWGKPSHLLLAQSSTHLSATNTTHKHESFFPEVGPDGLASTVTTAKCSHINTDIQPPTGLLGRKLCWECKILVQYLGVHFFNSSPQKRKP